MVYKYGRIQGGKGVRFMDDEETLTPDQIVAQIRAGLQPDQKRELEELQEEATKIPLEEKERKKTPSGTHDGAFYWWSKA